MWWRLVLASIIAVGLGGSAQAFSTDLIAFSYNRPLQMYALLESIEQHVSGLNEAFVVYRADSDDYEQAYQQVWERFDWVQPFKQGNNPRQDFKPLTMRCLNATDCPYVVFAVDDIIVKDTIDFVDCVGWLEETGAYGFYLRLGLHLRHNYPRNMSQPLPQLRQIGDNVLTWQFATGVGDWGYPNTVDMTVYRKQDVIQTFDAMHFYSPNTLEGNWSGRADKGKHGLCYSLSKIVNFPLNRVQNDCHNRHMDEISPLELLTTFTHQSKMDVMAVQWMINPSAHTEYSPIFVERD